MSELSSGDAVDPKAVTRAPGHLNSTGCRIDFSPSKGRGVFASQVIPAQTLVEISPVLLFSQAEYAAHGKYTVLDHYTFKWRDGRMALALGLGSLFNHSRNPNVSYTLDTATESIRYVTTRHVEPDEELCIFYGHKLWFDDAAASCSGSPIAAGERVEEEETVDGWGELFRLDDNEDEGEADEDVPHEKATRLTDDEVIPEDGLPFTRVRLTPNEEEEDMDAVRTEEAWAVDIVDPKLTTAMLRWLKQSGLDTPELAHLKRIRRRDSDPKMSLLLTYTRTHPASPPLPEGIALPFPYIVMVPRSAALTPTSLQLKNSLWPTVYAPRRKGEAEPWSRGRVRWAHEAMKTVVRAAREAQQQGELPIVAYVPVPYDEETQEATLMVQPMMASDTRTSTKHPLRHAVLNVIRAVAAYRASGSPSPLPSSDLPPILSCATMPTVASEPAPLCEGLTRTDTPSASASPTPQNGSHYLLTSLTLFTTHEPCIMCSMALLHSRVKEVHYLVPMAGTGGCGGAACVPRLEGVNHRYGIGRWKADGGLGSVVENDVDA